MPLGIFRQYNTFCIDNTHVIKSKSDEYRIRQKLDGYKAENDILEKELKRQLLIVDNMTEEYLLKRCEDKETIKNLMVI